MGKLDQLRQLGAKNVAESTGAARGDGLPPGLDLAAAAGMPARLVGLAKEKGAARIPIDRIVRDEAQPREEFDQESLARLAESLRTKGQLQPIRVAWDEARGVYVVLLGERRWRAAHLAGLTELSCIIQDGALDNADRLGLQLDENCLREDLKPIEQARSYRRLMEARGWSTRQLADELNIGQTSVVRALALLELPTQIQEQVEQGGLAVTVAHELAKLPSAPEQAELAKAVVDQGLTRAEVSEVIRAVRAKRPAPPSRLDPVTIALGGCSITVKWKRGDTTPVIQALRKAIRQLQEQGRAQDEQAA
jgi:ParB family chromosome partitioning protein